MTHVQDEKGALIRTDEGLANITSPVRRMETLPSLLKVTTRAALCR